LIISLYGSAGEKIVIRLIRDIRRMTLTWKSVSLYVITLNILLLPTAIGAKNTSFSVGINNLIIKLSDFPRLSGILIGHNKEWNLNENLIIERELNLIYKQAKFYNKRVWSYPGVLSAYDLEIKMVYFEIPILIKYSIPTNQSKIQLYLGPSLHLCLKGKVNRSLIKKIYNSYDESTTEKLPYYEISFIEDPGPIVPIVDNSSFGFNLGLQYKMFSKISELRYNFSKLRTLDAVEFNKYYHTLSLIISF
jgi:hypothetical protein